MEARYHHLNPLVKLKFFLDHQLEAYEMEYPSTSMYLPLPITVIHCPEHGLPHTDSRGWVIVYIYWMALFFYPTYPRCLCHTHHPRHQHQHLCSQLHQPYVIKLKTASKVKSLVADVTSPPWLVQWQRLDVDCRVFDIRVVSATPPLYIITYIKYIGK